MRSGGGGLRVRSGVRSGGERRVRVRSEGEVKGEEWG